MVKRVDFRIVAFSFLGFTCASIKELETCSRMSAANTSACRLHRSYHVAALLSAAAHIVNCRITARRITRQRQAMKPDRREGFMGGDGRVHPLDSHSIMPHGTILSERNTLVYNTACSGKLRPTPHWCFWSLIDSLVPVRRGLFTGGPLGTPFRRLQKPRPHPA